MLKSLRNLSDEEVVVFWSENPYAQEQRRTSTNNTQFENPENQTLVPFGLLVPITLQTILNN